MKQKFILPCLTSLIIIMMSCNNDLSTITCDPTIFQTTLRGGEQHVIVNSPKDWEVIFASEWISVTPESGIEGETDVLVKVKAGEPDSAVILFSTIDGPAVLRVIRGLSTVPEDELPKTDSKDGALSGLFSIAKGMTVCFSQGNLQYQASTDKWRFADHQYSVLGYEANNAISPSNSEWVDLFGWGTGNNPTLTSSDYKYYSSFSDWGANQIQNGGNIGGLWRTLTDSEWEYLFSGRDKATELRSKATVNNQYGYVFLPDNWEMPSGITFLYDSGNWSENYYSPDEWKKMEDAGAVFLPTEGYRTVDDVAIVNEGRYWSSTPVPGVGGGLDDKARIFVFFYGDAYTYYDYRSYGLSVRLVK